MLIRNADLLRHRCNLSAPTEVYAASLAMAVLMFGLPNFAAAKDAPRNAAAAARAGAVDHAQKMRKLYPDAEAGAQTTPPVIPQMQIDPDPSGAIATYQPNGPTQTDNNAFFLSLGTNGRTCFTCHQPQDGWSLSAQHAQDRFQANPNDPLFRLVDGATCPSDDVSTLAAKQQAYSLLLEKGLIRIGLPMPSQDLQFQIVEVDDPHDCNTQRATGLTSSTSGIVSVYRRPLPSTNLGFLSTIMWDGREPDLFSQAADATLGHAQADVAPTAAQQQQIVTFEGCTRAAAQQDAPDECANTPADSGVFTAQIQDNDAKSLLANGAQGGPEALAGELPNFYIGINDPLGLDPTGSRFTPEVFGLFSNWGSLNGQGGPIQARKAIARGEQLFNTIKINITGVAGLNDALNQQSISGFCGISP